MEKIIEVFTQNKQIQSLLIVLITVLIYSFFRKILTNIEKSSKTTKNIGKKGRTYFRLLLSTIRSVFIVIAIVLILQINGVNVNSLLAGLGILGIVVGLAVQDALKDIIRGITILLDNYFAVGDIVKYGDIEGKVIVIGLKTTKIRDLKNGYFISIANRNIEQIEVVSDINYIRVPMPYEVKVNRAEEAISDIVKLIKNNNNVDDCKYKGVTELADSSVQYLLEVMCKPEFKLQVRRDALRSILIGLDRHNIQVPFNQIDVHNK